MVHPQPQTLQGEQVAKPGTPLLIILSLVCKSDIKETHYVSSNLLFEKEWVLINTLCCLDQYTPPNNTNTECPLPPPHPLNNELSAPPQMQVSAHHLKNLLSSLEDQ